MIKYADRGLVKNGIVNKLFEHLYLAFTLISGIWGLTIGFISYVPTVGSNLKHSLTNVCVDQTKEYGIIKKKLGNPGAPTLQLIRLSFRLMKNI